MLIRRLLYIIILIMILTGCSRIKFAYNQLDWVIPFYLGNYIDLSTKQSIDLDKQVERFLAWHCSNHLEQYADLLRTANSDFQAGRITVERLEAFSLQIEGYWHKIMLQINPEIARLLLSANDDQLRQLFQSLDEQNQAWLAEYNSQTRQELNSEYQERMTETLKYWLGPLQETQIQMVKVWSDKFVPLGLEGLERRRNWQAQLRNLTVHRTDVPAFNSGINRLFLQPKQFRSPLYQQRLDNNRKTTIMLIDRIANSLTESQKKHLKHETLSIAQDFDELSCTNNIVSINVVPPTYLKKFS